MTRSWPPQATITWGNLATLLGVVAATVGGGRYVGDTIEGQGTRHAQQVQRLVIEQREIERNYYDRREDVIRRQLDDVLRQLQAMDARLDACTAARSRRR